MYNNYESFRHSSSVLRSVLTGILLLIGGAWLAFDAQAQVTGKVFRDFNANGLQDTPISSTASSIGEPGLPGIIVTAYSVTGTPVSVTSGVDGSYSFPNSGVTASGARLRLEFSGLANGAYSAPYNASATGSGTSTQFVTAGSSTTANYSVNYPSEYCNGAPLLTIPCFISGDASGTNVDNEHVVVTFPYSASSTLTGTTVTNTVNPTPIADAGQVGSVWGMAYQRETKRLFSAAFLKRHVGLGTGGLGGIYSTTNATGNTANGSLYVDLEAPPFSLTLGQTQLGTRTLPNDPTTSSADPNSFSLIGKVGLGSMALSDDGSKLYVVDLFNRQLLILTIGNPAKASLAAGDLVQVPLPPTATCTNGVARPFAVSVYRGKVYVGVVCTAESPGSTSANLSASIYEMDETTQTFNSSSVFSAPLTYPKGLVHAAQLDNGDQWETWTSLFSDLHTTLLSSNPNVYRTSRPQPILSDIDFTDNGDMVLSFMDRAGHQLGYEQVPPTGAASTNRYNGYIGGDMLRARLQGSSWVLESGGKVSSPSAGTLTGCGPTNGQGPGNGEFYCEDNYLTTHQETSQGGAVIIPGTNATVSINMDPLITWSGGTIWFDNTTGSDQKRYQLYHSTDATDGGRTYGKANGLGLPVALCDPAPVEIGNRIWLDSDKDGIQDPDETPIASVTVGLYQSGTLVATAVTNTKGEYYFSSATGISTNSVRYNLALVRGGAYELRIATAQTALASYTAASPTNAGGNDLTDNDFSLSGSNLVTSLTVGMSGNNVHTYDAAVVCQLPASVSLTTTAATCSGTANQNNGLVTIPGSITTVNRYSVISGTVTTGFAYSSATAIGSSFPLNIVSNAPNAGGTYTVRFYNGSNDCFIDQVVVVSPFSCACVPPVVTAQASSSSVCINQPVTLFATVSPSGSYTYSWGGPGGAVVTGGSSATATISGLTTAGVKTFTVTVSSSPSCFTTTLVSISVVACPTSLGDYVWLDTNKNGQQDGTETGVANVTATLFSTTSSAALATTLTNNGGNYLFSNLDPGSYYVVFTAPIGTTFTTANSGADASDSDVISLTGQSGSTGIYSLSAGEYNPTVDVGLVPLLGSIGNFVWKDANGNGIQDDGPNSGMSNVMVNLLEETNIPGQFMVVAATTTSTLGEYNFTGLSAGNYKIQIDLATVPFYCQPTAQTVVTPNDATNSKIGPTGETPIIVINPINPALRDYPKADAGFSPLPLGSIGDYVWKDTNNDGIQNDGATGVANVGMKLLNADGNYVVRGVLSGAQQNPSVTTSGTGLVYANFNPTTNVLNLMAGFSNLTGMVTMAHIHTGVVGTNGPVIVDLVPLGFPTDTYAGNFVASTTLTTGQATLLLANKLYLNVHTTTNGGGEIRAQLVTCEFTSSTGNYLFDHLPQGTYTVAVDTPTLPLTCVVSSKQNSTSATEATDSDFNATTGRSDAVAVVPSDPAQRDIRMVDLALVNPITGSIGNFVWKDNNNNGLQDPNEKGIANVTVELFTVVNAVRSTLPFATTVTSASGLYGFTGLPQGEYQLKFTLPASETVGCLITDKTNAGDDTRDSDIDPVTGFSPVITINPSGTGVAVNNLTVDLGVKRRIYDPIGYIYCYGTNTILTGGTIRVTGPGSVTIIKNGSDGAYQFLTDGTPGTYSLSYTHPSGYSVATAQRPAVASPLDPTGLDGSALDKDGVVDGWVQIGSVANSLTNPTGLSDGSAAANPYYLSFNIVGGDPYISANNLPIDCAVPVPCPTFCVPITIGKIIKSGRR